MHILEERRSGRHFSLLELPGETIEQRKKSNQNFQSIADLRANATWIFHAKSNAF